MTCITYLDGGHLRSAVYPALRRKRLLHHTRALLLSPLAHRPREGGHRSAPSQLGNNARAHIDLLSTCHGQPVNRRKRAPNKVLSFHHTINTTVLYEYTHTLSWPLYEPNSDTPWAGNIHTTQQIHRFGNKRGYNDITQQVLLILIRVLVLHSIKCTTQ